MSIVIGIDVGGSTTKIVGFRETENGPRMIEPQYTKATDPVTSTYGAFGKFTDENNILISDIKKVMMTGVGSTYVKKDLYNIECGRVQEFNCIGRGGRYLSGFDSALIVSMGTGTALVNAKANGVCEYLGGTGVGGGTLIGLSKLLINAESIEHITDFAEKGNLSNVDLKIKDIKAKEKTDLLLQELTAANFGNVSDVASKNDIALGIINMVYETVGMVSIFASRYCKVRDIVLTGNLTRLKFCREKFEQFNQMNYGVNFVIPEYAQYSTVIGCALLGL